MYCGFVEDLFRKEFRKSQKEFRKSQKDWVRNPQIATFAEGPLA
jgi:hypothetical protein